MTMTSREVKSVLDCLYPRKFAMDEQAVLVTEPNTAIPAVLTTVWPRGKPKKIVFSKDEEEVGHAAGVLYVSPEGYVLLLRRADAEPNFGGYWGLPGGKGELGETPEDTARRETKEEIGKNVKGKLGLLNSVRTSTGMSFHTFACGIDSQFQPKLNSEHTGYAWFPINALPDKLHPGILETIQLQLMHVEPGQANDMTETDWSELKDNFLKWINEEEDEFEHSEDSIAFDYATARSLDTDGKLHVSQASISKANVCGYYGMEIPDYKALGLDATRMYKLYRDPAELRAASATFNNLPILNSHVSFNTVNFDPSQVIGSTGTDASFDGTFLTNSLVFWVRDPINEIQSGQRTQLSCAYRYVADMTPGAANGENYDGVMRNIIGNHVALVVRGRAGPDVVVSDSALPGIKELIEMTLKKIVLSPKATLVKGALLSTLRPVLAADAKIDLNEILGGVTQANYKDSVKGIAEKIGIAVKGKTVKDANMNSVALALDSFVDVDEPDLASDEEDDPDKKPKITKDKAKDCAEDKDDDDKDDKKKPAFMKKDKAEDADDDEDDDKKKAKDGMITKEAMDSALNAGIELAVKRERANQRSIQSAIQAVKPYVGDLAIAFDSADEVYAKTLTMLGVEGVKDIHASAYPALLKSIPLPGARNNHSNIKIAQDSIPGTSKSLTDYFPGAKNIGHVN